MNQPTATWDQKDFLAATDALRTEAASLEAILTGAGKNVPPRPVAKASALDDYDAMAAHMAQLRAMVKLSISGHGLPGGPSQSMPTGNWNPDAQIAAAKQRADGDENLGYNAGEQEDAFNPDAALLRVRGAKNVTELEAIGPTRFAKGD
jgi:hypothetical protein